MDPCDLIQINMYVYMTCIIIIIIVVLSMDWFCVYVNYCCNA